ncbi:MAG: SprT-like domain-containing protein [Acidobacteria bacterium]|nr:SprT-like domain-containing protein [Acidobacteriota bacterium]
MHVESDLLFESPEQIYARVFQQLRPRTAVPEVHVSFHRFANANSFIKWAGSRLEVRMCDVLQGAPAPILEALAQILLHKLLRRPVPAVYNDRYRRFLNRSDVRRNLHLVRQIRGRKFVSGPEGSTYNLETLFEEINREYFFGLMARPLLGWSRRPSRTMLGHYDPSHNAIILSRILDDPRIPRVLVEYVMFHEMPHLRHPVEHKGSRRRVHTKEFREAEKQFRSLQEAKESMKLL